VVWHSNALLRDTLKRTLGLQNAEDVMVTYKMQLMRLILHGTDQERAIAMMNLQRPLQL